MRTQAQQRPTISQLRQYLTATVMRGARGLNPDEIKLMLCAFAGTYARRDRALFLLAMKTGGRATQILALRIKDVFDGKRFVGCVRFARKTMKGRRRGHSLPLHPDAKRALGRWLVELRQQRGTLAPNAWLFSSRVGRKNLSYHRYWEIVKMTAKKAGISAAGVSTHSPRKTVAALIYKRYGIVRAGAVLGHFNLDGSVDVVATARYIPTESEEDIRAALFSL